MANAHRQAALAASFLLAGAVVCPAGGPPRLLDASRDRVVRTAPVPTEAFPQAEVRVVRRDGAVVIQTVIVSRVFERVIAAIRKKEAALWPPGKPGHEDAALYTDALERESLAAERRFPDRGPRGDPRGRLLIEFVLSGEEAFVAFLEPEVRGDLGAIRIVQRRLLAVLRLSRRYVEEDMRAIAMDSLGLSRREAEEALKPLRPPALPPGRGTR